MKNIILSQVWLIIPFLLVSGCKKEIGPDHYYKLGLEWVKNEEPAEALANFSTAIEMNPKYAEAYAMRAECKQDMEQYAEARADFDTALKLDPKLATAFVARAKLDLVEELPEQAMIDADSAIRLDEKLGEAYLYRGHAKMQLEDYDLAIEDLLEANRLMQQGSGEANAQAHAMLGKIYFIKKDYTESIYNYSFAVDFYNAHIRRYPKHQVTVVSEKGKVWAGKAAYEAACKVFAGRAAAYLAQDQLTEAIEDVKKAMRLDETSSEALYQKAITLVRTRRFFEAKNILNKAIELEKDRADLYNLRGWISATCDQTMDRNGLAAVEDAKRACEMTNYKNADYLETLAAAYAETQIFDKALQWQNEAIILAGEDRATERRMRFQLYQSKKPYRMN
jgi:tetratricopeptide (TPR) repeat protein